MADTYWEPTDRDTFSRLWLDELATVPEFIDSTFHLVTGLLLPIWKSLPLDHPRVYAFTTDDGQRYLGRLVLPEYLQALGALTELALTPDEAWQALRRGEQLQCCNGLSIKPAKVMHETRLEVLGFEAGALSRLKALGCFSEIIAWKTRLFIPVGEQGPRVLAAFLDRHPTISIGSKG
jgi:hypothetical protein